MKNILVQMHLLYRVSLKGHHSKVKEEPMLPLSFWLIKNLQMVMLVSYIMLIIWNLKKLMDPMKKLNICCPIHTDSKTIFMLEVNPTALISLSRDMAKPMSIDLNNGMNWEEALYLRLRRYWWFLMVVNVLLQLLYCLEHTVDKKRSLTFLTIYVEWLSSNWMITLNWKENTLLQA